LVKYFVAGRYEGDEFGTGRDYEKIEDI